MNQKVNWFFEKDTKWKKEYQMLRSIILDCGLTEELKWGCPCYTFATNNIVLIHGFKGYCALLFHKGVLLKDSNNILVQQTENVQSARQIRFTHVEEIVDLKTTIKAYVFEAIEVEKAGLEVKMKDTSQFKMPEELLTKFEENPDLKKAFERLTPGRQRGYLLHFSQPKQSKTRVSRIDKSVPKILEGKGWNDR
ncbi:MAG: YdeI family protein [Cyclobacteriaceae bacterium]